MRRLLLILVFIGTSLGAPSDVRIFGGELAAPGQFPFIASLYDRYQFCGGSIIDKSWILTAAHCVDEIRSSNFILVGTNNLQAGGQRFNISRSARHENFNYDDLRDDIGLVRIDGEFTFDDLVQPVELVDAEADSSCIAAGWGTTEDEDFPNDLRFIELTALGLEDCRGYVQDDSLYLGPEQVCALGPVGKGDCYGDSGGPLVSDGKLAGIVSYGMAPCAKGYPDVYTRPSAYFDWIKQQIQE